MVPYAKQSRCLTPKLLPSERDPSMYIVVCPDQVVNLIEEMQLRMHIHHLHPKRARNGHCWRCIKHLFL